MHIFRTTPSPHSELPFFSYVAYIVPHFPLHAPAEDIAKYKDTYRVGWDAVRAKRWKKMQEIGLVAGDISAVEREVGRHILPGSSRQVWRERGQSPRPLERADSGAAGVSAGKMAIHAAMVDRMDQEIGRLIQQIRDMGQWDNTVVMFMSDNGCSAEMMVRDDGHESHSFDRLSCHASVPGPRLVHSFEQPVRRHKTWVHEGGIARQ